MRARSRLEPPPPPDSAVRLRCSASRLRSMRSICALSGAHMAGADIQERKAAAGPAGAAARRRQLVALDADRAIVFLELGGTAAAARAGRGELGLERAADTGSCVGRHGKQCKQRDDAGGECRKPPCRLPDLPLHCLFHRSVCPLNCRAPLWLGEVNLRFTIWQIRGRPVSRQSSCCGLLEPTSCVRYTGACAPS